MLRPGLRTAFRCSLALPFSRFMAPVVTSPVIVVGLSGHGLLELGAYDSFLGGRLEDDPLSDDALGAALANVPVVG